MEEKVGGTEKEKLEFALGRVPSSYKGSMSLYATVTGRLAGISSCAYKISSCAYKTSGWAVFLLSPFKWHETEWSLTVGGG